jgi:hypothetical protein
MVDQQHHDAADESDQDAPKVEAGYAMAAKNAEYNAANNAPGLLPKNSANLR